MTGGKAGGKKYGQVHGTRRTSEMERVAKAMNRMHDGGKDEALPISVGKKDPFRAYKGTSTKDILIFPGRPASFAAPSIIHQDSSSLMRLINIASAYKSKVTSSVAHATHRLSFAFLLQPRGFTWTNETEKKKS